jgi:hypothetical protein
MLRGVSARRLDVARPLVPEALVGARFDVCFAARKAGTFDRHGKDDAQFLDLIQEPVDQASWIQNPGARAPHSLDCLLDHRVPSLSMMSFHDTGWSDRKVNS